jgi:hypothetical protein
VAKKQKIGKNDKKNLEKYCREGAPVSSATIYPSKIFAV